MNKRSLVEYPMLSNPALWGITVGILTILIGWIIATDPFVSYVDHFPFNRNWTQLGNGIVIECQGPFRYKGVPMYYVTQFAYSYSDKQYTSQCVFFEPVLIVGDCAPLLIYKNNPHVVKIDGSYVTTVPGPFDFYFPYVLLMLTPIAFMVFVKSFPCRKKKKRLSKRLERH